MLIRMNTYSIYSHIYLFDQADSNQAFSEISTVSRHLRFFCFWILLDFSSSHYLNFKCYLKTDA